MDHTHTYTPAVVQQVRCTRCVGRTRHTHQRLRQREQVGKLHFNNTEAETYTATIVLQYRVRYQFGVYPATSRLTAAYIPHIAGSTFLTLALNAQAKTWHKI